MKKLSCFLVLLSFWPVVLVEAQVDTFVPQVVGGREPSSGLFLKTTFHMWNLSNSEVTGQIDLFRNSGEPILADHLKPRFFEHQPPESLRVG